MSSKTAPSYLLLRSSGYYFRLRVPNDLRGHIKQSEIKYSIGLSNRTKALKAARKLSVITESLFDEIRIDPSEWSSERVKAWREQNLKLNTTKLTSISNNVNLPVLVTS